MRRGILLHALCVVLVCGCGSAPPAPEFVRVTAFSQGLMRQNERGVWSIYEQGSEFTYRDNGMCKVAGKDWHRCMWYGFALSYAAGTRKTILDCLTESAVATNAVDAEGIKGENLTTHPWDLTLLGHAGVIMHPQYTVGDPAIAGTTANTLTTVCKLHGTEVFRYVFAIREDLRDDARPAA